MTARAASRSALERWAVRLGDRGFLVLALAVLVGAALRIVGTTWGLPTELHSDEWVIVDGALDLARRNSFEPSFYFRPDHVEIQLSYIAYEVVSRLVFQSPVETAYGAHPAVFLLVSRLITSAFGIAMIVLAYAIGARFSARVGLIAAVLFAIFPPFVLHSHFAAPDVPLTAMLMVVVLACVRYLEKPSYQSLLVACAGTAVAIAVKYPAAIATVMIGAVVIIAAVRDRRPSRILAHGALSVAGVVGFLFTVSPVLFTNARAVATAFSNETTSDHPGADGLTSWGNAMFYAGEYALAAGVILTLLSVVGVVVAIRARNIIAIPLTLGAIMWILLSFVALHWERWGVPMYITPLFFAAIGISALGNVVRERFPEWRWRRPANLVVAALIVSNLFVGSIATVAPLISRDTRIVSQAYIAQNNIDATNSLFEAYTPLSPAGGRDIMYGFDLSKSPLSATESVKRFAITSSCYYDRFEKGERFADEREFYRILDRDLRKEYQLDAQRPWDRSPLEVLNIIGATRQVIAYASGAAGGCDISVYTIPERVSPR